MTRGGTTRERAHASHLKMWRSVPQIPPPKTLTRISPGPGRGTGTSVSPNPGPASGLIRAFMRCGTGSLPDSDGPRRRRAQEAAVGLQREAQRRRPLVGQPGDDLHRQAHRLLAVFHMRVGHQDGVDAKTVTDAEHHSKQVELFAQCLRGIGPALEDPGELIRRWLPTPCTGEGGPRTPGLILN